jgi:glucosamine 6-phosphate synthetase-like amidotransferase/phosphosugar isomerase protein
MNEKREKHPYWIYETVMGAPEVLAENLESRVLNQVDDVADKIVKLNPETIFFAGTGSSYMTAFAQSFGFNVITDLPATSSMTSELRVYANNQFKGNCVLVLNTHSGKSPLDIRMVEVAKSRGVFTVGVTDIEDTPFAKAVDATIIGSGGAKNEMPATRTYSSAIFRGLMLAIRYAQKKGSLYIASEYDEKIRRIPGLLRKFLDEYDKKVPGIVETLLGYNAYYVIGAGPNISTALEGAMALTQGTGMPSFGYDVVEYLHGPIQSLSKKGCVLSVIAPGPFRKQLVEFSKAAQKIGAKIVTVGVDDEDMPDGFDTRFVFPDVVPEILTPIIYCAPFWLLSYYFSLKTGRNPDTLSMEKDEFKASRLAELKKIM